MKRLITLIFALAVLSSNSWGQVSGYIFASSSGSYTAITGGTVLINGTSAMDSWASTAITIPSFTFNGIAYTTAYVTSNGNISLGGSAPSAYTTTGISTGNGSGINICPFSADLDRATTTTSTEIRWETVGNEIVFQWQQVKRYGATENWDMQARLNTSNGEVVFVYRMNSGPGSTTTYQPQVGIRTSSTDYKNRLVSTGTEDWPTSLPGTANTNTCRFTSAAPAKSFTSGLTYTFSTPVPCVAPTVQPTAMVLTPGATIINGSFTPASGAENYLVIRSLNSSLSALPTDGVRYTVGTSLGGGTIDYYGTGSSWISSGLNPSTLYYYFIFAANDATCGGGPLYLTSNPLTSSASTTAAATYTWNQTGTASFTVPANWTPARNVADPTDILQFNGGGTTTVTDIPTQTIRRLTISNNTTVNLQAAATATLTLASDGTSADELSVESGSTLMSNGNAAALTITYSGTGSTGNIAGTMELSATGTYAHNFNFTGGTTPVTTVSGTLANGQNGGSGVPTITSGTATLVFTASGTYKHNFTTSNGTIPTATWNASSNCNIVGYTASNMVPSGLAQTFGNFTWNCTGQGTNNYNLALSSTTFNVAGTFSVLSTGTTGSLRLSGTGSYSANVGSVVVSGGILDLQSGASGTPSLNISGALTQSAPGELKSTATSSGNPTLHFNGTINQTVTFATQPTGPITFRVSNPAGITLNASFSTFTFGNGTLGGVRISTNAGTPIALSGSLTALAYNAANSTLTYDAAATCTATSIVYPAASSPANLTLNVGSMNALSIPFDRTVSNTLTLTAGEINMGSYTLTLGTGTSATGTLSGTAGIVVGNFKRWFAASTGSKDFLVGIPGIQRKATINFTAAPSAGGTLTVNFIPNDPGDAGLPLTEGSITVNTASNSGYWKIDAGDGLTGGTYTGTFTATNFPGVNSYAGLVLIKRPSGGGDWILNGTHVTTTGSNAIPVLSRTGMTGFSEFGVGGDAASNPMSGTTIYSITSGNWGDLSTWSTGSVPTSGDNVGISAGHTVTTASGTPPYQCINLSVFGLGILNISSDNLNISGSLSNNGTVNITGGNLSIAGTFSNNGNFNSSSGNTVVTGGAATGITNAATTGTFNVSGGTVTLGPAGGSNRTFLNSGTLTVSGTGTLNINGNLNHASGATFNQSGGNINIDGNAAGVAGNSVASGTYLLGLYAPVSWTGGTLTIVDPHANTTATNSIYYNSGTSSDVSSSHTTRFGDGVSSDAGGNVAGYSINTYAGSGKINFGTVIVNGPGSGTASGTNRMLTLTTWTIGIRGDLTINNNGEFNTGIGVILGGNLVVNTGGILTHTGTFSLALGQGTSSVVNPSSQQITNTGTIRNLAASPTANFSSLTINNSNATGVTLNSPISVSGTLTLTSGFVNTTATNLLTLGTATAAGTMSGGSATAFINGPFARTFAVSRTASGTYTQTTLYPVGKGTTYQPMWIDPSTSSGGPVVLSGEAFLTNSGTMGAGVTSLSQARWEGLVKSGGANLTNSYLQISDAGILASNAILQAPTAAGAYGGVPASSIYTAGPPITLKTGSSIPAASYLGYFAYGNLTPCATPTAQPTSFVASYITSTGFTGSFTAASPAADYYLVVRYANPSSPTNPADYTLYSVGGTLGTGTVVSVSNSTSFIETALTPGATYDYYIYSYNNSGCSGPVYLTTSPLFSSVTTCSAAVGVPGTPTASIVETDGFRASWTASSTPGVTYLLDVATNSTFTNFVSGYNGKNVGTALYDDITGLSANTTYYVRVRAYDGVNGCYSTYSGTLTQATECDAIASFPFTEGFEPASTTQACWRVIDNNSDADLWNMNYTTNPRTGTECAMLYTDYNTTNDDWLITPQLTLTGMQRIKFWTRCQSASEPDEVEVLLSTTGRLPSDFTNTLMASTPINFITYAEYTINLNAYSGNVYIAFVRRSAPADGWRLYIDDVTVENIPAVPAIVVDPTSIDFGYTPSGGTSTVSYYVLSGLFLNPPAGNLTVTPPANFEVSLSISSGFSASAINVPYVGGAVTDTVYARFKPTSPNTPYSGNIVNDGGGASAQNVAVSGTSQLVYCAAGASSTSYEKISRIQFGSIDNSSTSTAGYEDFTAISTDAGKGEALSFTGTILGGYSSDQFLVWIDFNQNGSFTDSGEDVYVSPTGVGPHTGEITISATALSGTTRMRVRMHDSSIGPNTTPCGNSSFGQVEDYTVNITAPPACSAPSGLFTTNIENNAATLNWTNMPDSFFDVFFGEPGFDPGSEGTMIPDISTNSCLVENLEPNTDYEWYVIQDCGFETPKVDNFWFSMEGPGNLLEPLSGGTFDEPGEDGIWYLYDQAPGGMDWWNIWFYNDPLDTNKIKKIRMGFWIQSYNGSDPGLLNYVINWSDSTWEGSGFPTPSEEQYIRRSPVNGPVIVNTGGPQWIELYFIIPDFNPEWISVDIWGENIMVEQTPMAPPLSSELFSYYDPILMNGGIIVHECLPETTLSSFSGPISFSTLCDAFDIPVFEDFDEVDLGNIPRCWSRETYTSDWVAASNVGSYSSPYAIVNYYDADYAKDDWFFTGGLNLTAGTSYDVQFYLQAPGYLGVGEKLEVKFGSAASSTSMTGGTIYQNADIQIATYTLQQGSFVAPATGVYYIGWHAYSDADIDYIAIDDINIAASPFIWTGAVSGDWNNTANWNLGTVPSLNSNVIIPVVTLPAVYPNVTGTVNINSITIQSGAIINIQAPGVLNVLNP